MKRSIRIFRVFLCFGMVLMIMSCSLTSTVQKITGKNLSTSQNSNNGGTILPDPTVGLTGLAGYSASLKQDIIGTLDGRAYERHSQTAITRNISSGDYDFVNEVIGTEIDTYTMRLMVKGDAYYRWLQDEKDCQGMTGKPSTGNVIEPASLLLPVLNANRVGNETINQIASVHYRFDQNNLPISKDGTLIAGDVWIAEQGGYVVMYVLNSPLPNKITGKDLETTQTWTYELALMDPNESIILPEDCIPVPSDLPITSDAQNIIKKSGWMTYNTNLSGRQVLDFYLKELPALGWELPAHIPQGEISLPYIIDFSATDQKLSLLLTENEENGLDIDLFVTSIGLNTNPPTDGASEIPLGTLTPAPTINPVDSGLPLDIPLYPNATDLYKIDQYVMFYTKDGGNIVANFYRLQMAANGWTLNDEVAQTDVTMQTWEKSGKITRIVMATQDGRTLINISLPGAN